MEAAVQPSTIHDEWMKDPEYARAYAEEGAILNALEDLLGHMEAQGIGHADLAAKLGISAVKLRRFFGGNDVSLRMLARIGYELGLDVKVTMGSRNEPA